MKKRLFCCYSADLKQYLYQQNIRYEICGINPKSQNMFWVYIRDNNLNIALDRWFKQKA